MPFAGRWESSGDVKCCVKQITAVTHVGYPLKDSFNIKTKYNV